MHCSVPCGRELIKTSAADVCNTGTPQRCAVPAAVMSSATRTAPRGNDGTVQCSGMSSQCVHHRQNRDGLERSTA
ncbi:hypothetical protein XAR_2273 [Xanthomonas citri pv. glycines str. 8ra]|nr:hypothetical protein XAR_2273 [Xanthomonas citri pv. glycines str. 8ra]